MRRHAIDRVELPYVAKELDTFEQLRPPNIGLTKKWWRGVVCDCD